MISTEWCGRGPEGVGTALTLKCQQGQRILEQTGLGGADGTGFGLGLGSTSVVGLCYLRDSDWRGEAKAGGCQSLFLPAPPRKESGQIDTVTC